MATKPKRVRSCLSCTVVCFLLLISYAGLAKDKKIVFSTMNWAPYYGKKLENEGFFTQISKAAFKQVGYDLEVRFVPWQRALDEAKNGRTDGLMGGYFKKERTKFLHYTQEIIKVDEVFLSKKGANITYKEIKDLRFYKIGSIIGNAYNAEWEKLGLAIEKVKHYDQNLLKLIKGRVDLIPGDRIMWIHTIKTKYPQYEDKIELVKPPFASFGVFNLISRKNPNHQTIVTDFNRGLSEIKKNGAFDKILAKYGFN